jgi:hypothetical protein
MSNYHKYLEILSGPYNALETKLENAERQFRLGEISREKLIRAYNEYVVEVRVLDGITGQLSKDAGRRPICTLPECFRYFNEDYLSRKVFK